MSTSSKKPRTPKVKVKAVAETPHAAGETPAPHVTGKMPVLHTGPDGRPLPPVPPAPEAPPMTPSRSQPGVQAVGPVARTPVVHDPMTGRDLTPVPPHMSTMVGGVAVAEGSRLAALLVTHTGKMPVPHAGQAQAEMASLLLMVDRWGEVSAKLVELSDALLAAADGEAARFYAAAAILAEVTPSDLAALAGDVREALARHAALLQLPADGEGRGDG